MSNAYNILYTAALVVIGLLVIACLVRAIRGPRIADRVIAANMIGTLVVITICILSFIMNEGYLIDIAIIYTMLSFLAVLFAVDAHVDLRQQHHGKEGQHHVDDGHVHQVAFAHEEGQHADDDHDQRTHHVDGDEPVGNAGADDGANQAGQQEQAQNAQGDVIQHGVCLSHARGPLPAS